MKQKTMIKILTAIAMTAMSFGSVHAADAGRLTVIELFTSQGCSSCPPADSILKTMRDRPGVLTLSWAVDYWDRLGWEDTFASTDSSMRQKAYNKRLGRGGVFTPQMVFDGRLQCVGSMADEVRDGIKAARAIKRSNRVPALTLNGDTVKLSLGNDADAKMLAVRVVWYLADADVEIGDGENQGRKLHYTNVVLDSEVLEDWNGDAKTFSLDAAAARALGADHVAVLLQDYYGHGAIMGAAYLPL